MKFFLSHIVCFVVFFLSGCENRWKSQDEVIMEMLIHKQLEQRVSYLEKGNETLYTQLQMENSSNYDLKSVYEITRKVLKELRMHRHNLIRNSGGYNSEGEFRDIRNDRLIYKYFIEEKNSDKLRKMLIGYSEFLSEKGVKTVDFILDGKDDPLFRKDPKYKEMKFEEIYFEKSDLINVLNILSLLSMDVVSAERMYYCMEKKCK